MNRIITIGREFGSGGREFGRRLAEALGFAYYDQEIISEIAKRTSLSEQYVEAIVEHQPSFSFPIHIGRSFYPAVNPAFEQTMAVYQEQARIITLMAAKSNCVNRGAVCGLYFEGIPAVPDLYLCGHGKQNQALPGKGSGGRKADR